MTLPTNVETVNAAGVAAIMTPLKAPNIDDHPLDPTDLQRPNTAESAVNPITAKTGRFDPTRLRLAQSFAAGATTRTSPITARKPDPHNWFMAHPDPAYHFMTMVLDIKAERETYLVEPGLREELGRELTPKVIVPCITRQSNIFLWSVSLPGSTGRTNNTWTQSALDAVQEAMQSWIRLVANSEAGGYDAYHPRVQIDPPVWPALTLEEMLEKAFGHYLIDSLDHPRVRALLGEVSMLLGNKDFYEVVVADSEFRQRDGERPRPKVFVAHGLVSGCTYRMFGDDLLSWQHPPYPIGPDCLFVAFHAPVEISVHHALGWEDPVNVLDLHVEFRNFTNGRYLPSGSGLIGALVYFGLEAMNPVEKTKNDEGRELAMSDRVHTAEEWQRLVDYCHSDVDRTCRLFLHLLPHIDIERALLRGRYMVAAAHIEGAGIPTDTEALTRLGEHWDGVRLNLIQRVNADYGGIFDGLTLKADRWERWLEAQGIPWPQLPTDYLGRNRLAMDEDTFRERARIYPAVAPIHELRKMLGKMRINSLTVGADGRNRTGLWPFTARTGRNQPRSSEHIMGPSVWLRGLIRAQPGNAVVYLDYNQQEFGIAAALAGDPAMTQAYHSSDPYLTFAKQAGAAPPNATKASHGAIRDQFKTCALGTLYSMGANTLAERTGLYIPYAADLLRLHRKTYPQFWGWSDRVVDYALLHNHLNTTFGWNLFIEGEPNPNSLRNFPMQGNGAEMLRLACCLAVERGVKVIAPVHDALLIEARGGDLVGAVVTARRAMEEASAIVLGGMALRTEFDVFRYPLRYMDEKRGRKMWNMVFRIIRELEAGK